MYPLDYKFRDVYLLTTAADDEEETPKRAEMGLGGWIECYPESRLAGSLFCGGVNAPCGIKYGRYRHCRQGYIGNIV